MSGTKKTGIAAFVAGVVTVLSVLVVVGLVLVYSGAYNIAATEDHISLTRWAFETTLRNSVVRRAASAKVPESFTPRMIEAGAAFYKDSCQRCHAGPGVERASWASGMRPRPPHLTEAASHWQPEEIFWLVKHGAKMTGMPAFGPTHGDELLWNVVGFVRELPAMTPEQYGALGGGSGVQ